MPVMAYSPKQPDIASAVGVAGAAFAKDVHRLPTLIPVVTHGWQTLASMPVFT